VTRASWAGVAAAALPALAVLRMLISKVGDDASRRWTLDSGHPLPLKRSASRTSALPSSRFSRDDRRRSSPFTRDLVLQISAMAALLDGDHPAALGRPAQPHDLISPWASSSACCAHSGTRKPPATMKRASRRQPRQPQTYSAGELLRGALLHDPTDRGPACATRAENA